MKKTYLNRHTLEGDILKPPTYFAGESSRLELTIVTKEERMVRGHLIVSTPYHDVVLHGSLADRFAPGRGNELEVGEYVHLEGPARSRDHKVQIHAYKFHVVAEEE